MKSLRAWSGRCEAESGKRVNGEICNDAGSGEE
jgi:hypothetical protein